MNEPKVAKSFSFGQVARLSGVKPRTLDHWAATNFLGPSVKKACGTGTKRVYSFSDVVAARVARELRTAGVSLQALRKVVKQLRRTDFGSNLADARLIISGRDVYLTNNQELVSLLNNPGQTHFTFSPGQTHRNFMVHYLGPTVTILMNKVAKVKVA